MAVPSPPVHRRRRWPRRLRWTILGLLALLGIVYALRGPLLSRPLSALIARQASQALGCRCEVGGVHGDFFHHLDIQGFATIGTPASGPLTQLSVRHIGITYSLLTLVRGLPLQAVSHLELDDLSLSCDLTRPPAARPAKPASAPQHISSLLPFPLPSIQVNGQLQLAFPLAHGQVGHLRIGSFRIAGDGKAASLDLTAISLAELGIEQERWACRCDLSQGGDLHAQSFGPLAGIMLRSIRIIPEGDSERIEAQLAVARSHLEMTLANDHLGVRLGDFDVAALPMWVRWLVPGELPSAGTVNGLLAMSLGGPEALSIDAHIQGLVWRALLPAEVMLRATVSMERVHIEECDFDNRTAHLALSDIEASLAQRWLTHAPADIECTITDLAQLLLQLRIPLPTGICTAIPMSVQATIHGHAQVIDLCHLEAQAGTSQVHLDAAMAMPGAGSWQQLHFSQASWNWHLAASDFPCLGPAWQGAADGSGHASGDIRHLQAAGAMSARQLRLAGHEVGALQASCLVAFPQCEITRLTIDQTQASLQLSAKADVMTRRIDHLDGAFAIRDLGIIHSQLPHAPAVRGALEGALQVEHLTPGTLRSMMSTAAFSLTLHGSGLGVGTQALGDLAVSASLAEGHLEISHAELSGAVHAVLALSAVVTPGGAYDLECRQLELAMRSLPLMRIVLHRVAHLSYQPGTPPRIAIDGLDLDALGGHISLQARVDEQLDAHIHLYRLQPWPLLPSWFPSCQGMIDCDGDLTGTPHLPLVRLHLATIGLRVRGRGAFIRLDARQDAQGCTLDAFNARITGVLEALGTGSWPVHIGFDGSSTLPGAPRGILHLRSALVPGLLPPRSGLPRSGIATLAVNSDRAGARVDLAVRECVVGWVGLAPSGRAPSDEITSIDAHLVARGAGWQSRLEARDSAGMDLNVDAHGGTRFDPWRPYRFLRSVLGDVLAVKMSLSHLQLTRLQPLAPWLVHLSGLASGEMHVTGTMQRPRWDGELHLQDLAMKTRSDVPALTDGQGTVRITGYRVAIDHLQGRMGYAPIGIEGWADLSGGQPVVDFHLTADNALVVQNQSLRLRVAGAIAVTGALSQLNLSGKLKVVDALYSQPFELLSRLRPSGAKEPLPTQDQGIKLFSVRDEPLASLTFNVDLHATQTLHVRTNLFSGNASMDLHLGGTGLSPIPTGQIWVDDAKIRLPFSSLSLTHADMVFTKNNPFFPHLDAMGETRSKGYDLTVRVSGNMPNVVVTVESDPPLSNNDGIMLLTTGLTSYDRDQAGASRSQLTSVGEYLAKEIWGQVSAAPDPDAKPSLFDLDRLDLSIGQELSITGQETIEAEYELSDHFYLRGERDLFNDYNLMLVLRIRER